MLFYSRICINVVPFACLPNDFFDLHVLLKGLVLTAEIRCMPVYGLEKGKLTHVIGDPGL